MGLVEAPPQTDQDIPAAMLATPAQLKFIGDLLDKKDLHEGHKRSHIIKYDAFVQQQKNASQGLTKHDASRWIDRLKSLPDLGRGLIQRDEAAAKAANTTLPEVPNGHYAVKLDGEDEFKFYRVNKPTKGKWTGYVFLDRQSSDDYLPVKYSSTKLKVLQAIVDAGIESCLANYGHEIGRCGICRRTLTKDESIRRGIGPVCYNKTF